MKIEYVAGFLFTPDGSNVCLIQKKRPEWQKGKLNAVGGHIEENESPEAAMQREFEEETGVKINWDDGLFLRLKNEQYNVYFFRKYSSEILYVKSVTDEKVLTMSILNELNTVPVTVAHFIIPNLKWIIPLALDRDAVYSVVQYK